MKTPIVLALAALCAAALPAHARSVVVNQALTEKEVLAAQQGWCKALVDISTTGARNGQPAAKALAEQVIDSAEIRPGSLAVVIVTLRKSKGDWPPGLYRLEISADGQLVHRERFLMR